MQLFERRLVIDGAPLAVVLPDVILDEYTVEQARGNLVTMKHRFNETAVLQIMVEAVANEEVLKL